MTDSLDNQFLQIRNSRRQEDSRAEHIQSIRHVLDLSWDVILAQHRGGSSGETIVLGLSARADSLIRHLYEEVCGNRQDSYTILALGGYGRGNLNPRSDIDLLFLSDKVDPDDQVTRHVLHTLWDLGFDIGHSTRTLADCIAAGREDEESLTSMLEARFLIGDVTLAKRLARSISANFLGRKLRPFISKKLEKRQLRHARAGLSVQLLEPNVKESPGGLRDTHVVGWLLKATRSKKAPEGLLENHLLTKIHYQAYTQAADFLLRTRNELHFTTGKAYDVLEHDLQPIVAEGLSYNDHGQMMAVEHFMRDYYLHARNVKHLTDLICERFSGRPSVAMRTVGLIARRPLDDGAILTHTYIGLPRKRKRFFKEDPYRLLSLFLDSQRFGVPLNEPAQQAIKNHVHLIDDAFRRSNQASRLFLSILSAPQGVARTLHIMHELGVLGQFVPEFRSIDCLFQYNRYHIYTADEHTLVAIEALETLAATDNAGSDGPLKKVLNELKRRDLLYLAILMHDVGKSARNDDHSSTGAQMTQDFLERLGLSSRETGTVVFLVQNHLSMSQISQRRDLSDDNLITDFASQFDDPDTLRMLYLVTFADLSSVTRSAWTEWKGHLLWELYLKAFNVLTQNESASSPSFTSSSLLEELSRRFQPERIEKHLGSLPPKYAELNTVEDIGTHLELIERMGKAAVALSVSHRGLFLEVTICTEDKPYRLSEICGVLATNDINIFSAQAYTRTDGVVLDIFQVTTLEGAAEISISRQKRMEDQLNSVFLSRLSTEELFARHQKRWSRRRKPSMRIETEIIYENNISGENTVIDIFAQDAVGLLYKITRTLSNLGLDIYTARVSTQADRAVDSFYGIQEWRQNSGQ
jgi:[protein-PII] uridylyltransferase